MTDSARPLTAAHLLFGEDQDTEPALAQTRDDQGALGSLDTALRQVSQVGRQAVHRQVADVAQGLLDLDLGDLVVAGWRKEGELAAAAERTAADPHSSEVVELASHLITSKHRPYVDLLINDVHMATVGFELDIEFLVRTLVATVRGGHVTNLRSGSCEATGTLAVEGVQVASRRISFELPLVIRWPLMLKPRK
jgi:hypothetical protein